MKDLSGLHFGFAQFNQTPPPPPPPSSPPVRGLRRDDQPVHQQNISRQYPSSRVPFRPEPRRDDDDQRRLLQGTLAQEVRRRQNPAGAVLLDSTKAVLCRYDVTGGRIQDG